MRWSQAGGREFRLAASDPSMLIPSLKFNGMVEQWPLAVAFRITGHTWEFLQE
jgi:hypothetical protein